MYYTLQQLIDKKILIQPGENLVNIEVQNRIHTQLYENANVVYVGCNNLINQLGVSAGEGHDSADIPYYTSTNYLITGLNLKAAIEFLDRAIYNIYTMTITSSPSGTVSGTITPGGSDYIATDYKLKVGAIDLIYTSTSTNQQIVPFGISAVYYRGQVRVQYQTAYRSYWTQSNTYPYELKSSDQGSTFVNHTNSLGQLASSLHENSNEAYTYWGGDSCAYKDKFGYERHLGVFSNYYGLPPYVETKWRLKYWIDGTVNDYGLYLDNPYSKRPYLNSYAYTVVCNAYVNAAGNVFVTSVNVTTKQAYLQYSGYDDDQTTGPYNSVPILANRPKSLSVLLRTASFISTTSLNAKQYTNFIFDNPNTQAPPEEKMVWVYLDASGTPVYELGSADNTSWTGVQGNFTTDYFEIPAYLWGSPTAMLLVNNRVLISYIYWVDEGYGVRVPYLTAHLSGIGGLNWETVTQDISSILPSDLFGNTHAFKVSLVQVGGTGDMLGFFCVPGRNTNSNPIYDSELSKIYRVHFTLEI